MIRKKCLGVFLFLGCLGALSLSASGETQRLGTQIRVYGGVGYLSGGDLNTGMGGIFSQMSDMAQANGFLVTGEYHGAHFGPAVGADFIVPVTARLGIGLGLSYLQASKLSEVTLTVPPPHGSSVTTASKPSLHAFPVKVSLFYSFPAGAITVNLHTGLGLYLAKASAESYDLVPNETSQPSLLNDQPITTSLRAGIGIHGGVGLEYKVAAHVALFVEAQGQYARISGFSGTETYTNSRGRLVTLNGPLCYFELTGFVDLHTFRHYPTIQVCERVPQPDFFYQNSRAARVNFSGGEFMTGIAFRF